MLTWALGHALVRVIGTTTAHEWVPGGQAKARPMVWGRLIMVGWIGLVVMGRCQVDKR